MKKILIIDDSLMDRKLLASLLKRSGIENEVVQAVDGEEGLRTLSANYQDIGVIFLDWQMPKMNGIEFMKAVTQVQEVSAIPIIMITASGAEEDKNLAYSANPNLAGYLVKPYKPEVLVQKTRTLLNSST